MALNVNTGKMEPEVKRGDHVVRMLNKRGDEVLAVWKPTDTVAADLAKQVVEDRIGEGWLVFKSKGKAPAEGPVRKGEFDPAAKEYLVMSPFRGG